MSDAAAPLPVSPPEAGPPSPRSRAAYIVLALLLGTFGVHNLYAGRWISGLLQSVLTAPSLWLMAGWMKQIQPLAASLSGDDPAAALDNIAALAQAGVPSSPLLLGAVVSGIWAALDLFLVKTDGQGRRLR